MKIDKKSNIIKGPYNVAVDVTYKCNYLCKHCYNSSGDNIYVNDELSDNELMNFVKDVTKISVHNICFCGGEPLLRLELICQAATYIYNHSESNVTISLVSNGYYLNDFVARKLKESHINRIQISLDGATQETCFKLRQDKLAFERAINALKVLYKNNFINTTIAFCPTSFNIDELEQVYEICCENGVSEIRIQPLMNSGRAMKNNDIIPSKKQYIKLLRLIDKLQDEYNNKNVKITWADPLEHIFRATFKPEDTFLYLSIKANGNIAASPYLPLSFGNVKKHTLTQYWEKGLFNLWELPFVKDYLNELTCIDDMSLKNTNLPKIWYENDIMFDIIDNNILG